MEQSPGRWDQAKVSSIALPVDEFAPLPQATSAIRLIIRFMISASCSAPAIPLCTILSVSRVSPGRYRNAKQRQMRSTRLGMTCRSLGQKQPGGNAACTRAVSCAPPRFHPSRRMAELHHAPVAFGLIVGEGHGRIVKEAQRVFFACCEAQEEIVSGSARLTTAPFAGSLHGGARQRRLGLMEGEPFGENGVVTALETFDESRFQRNASFSREIGRVTGAAQQPLHLARPVFLLDLDQRLQFAQMMGVAQGMQHAWHRVVGLPVIVHDDADDIRQQAAALGADAIEGEQGGARHMQPLRLAADAKAGLVHVLDGAPATRSRTVSTKSCRRSAQVRLIRAIVAAASLTPNRSAISSARRSSGSN